MKLPTAEFTFRLLTPCFCGGADNQAAAEMRVPSIRGQVRWWHRRLMDVAAVNRIWGVADEACVFPSKVALWVDPPFDRVPSRIETILPHKPNRSGKRPALPADTDFTLTLQRLPQCSPEDWKAALGAVKLWLLLGGLGLRCNRAAGSVWPLSWPYDPTKPEDGDNCEMPPQTNSSNTH